MSTGILLSYRPFASTKKGLDLSLRFGRLPFEDASIRTEPSLNQDFPSVTGPCRKGRVIKMADSGFVLVYVTSRANYLGVAQPRQSLTAILRVKHRLDDHEAAQDWYSSRGLPIPMNCIHSEPLPEIQAVFGYNRDERRRFTFEEAEGEYQRRGRMYPQFLVCDKLFVELSNPPEIDLELLGIDRKSTQMGKPLDEFRLQQFFEIAGLNGLS